jgi:hypothetical protein
MRKPIATIVTTNDHKMGAMALVLCNDGSVWELDSDTDHVTDSNEFGWYWYQLPAIPGTESDK